MAIKNLFATPIYFSNLGRTESLRKSLHKEIQILRKIDEEGANWSEENYLQGFTSYGSMTQLHHMSPYFAQLKKYLDRHVNKYAKTIGETRELELTDMWFNIMPFGAHHSGHIHPHSIVSGTYYVSAPKGSSPLKLEDPRLPLMMSAPMRSTHFSLVPKNNHVVLFESWLRHEVAAQKLEKERVSVSFNYG